MKLTNLTKTLCAAALIGSIAACSSPYTEVEALDPICPPDETKDWLVENDRDTAVSIIVNNRLIGRSCDTGA